MEKIIKRMQDRIMKHQKENEIQIKALKNLRIRIQQRRNIKRNSNEDTKAFDIFENDLGNIINELSDNKEKVN